MTADQIHKYHHLFTDIYSRDEKGKIIDEVNPIPEDVLLTVYIEGNNFDDIGYLYNMKSIDIGIDILIAKKWILQSDLEEAVKNSK